MSKTESNKNVDENITDDMPAQTDNKEDPQRSAAKKVVLCAVLYDNVYGKHGDIVELSEVDAKAAYEHGYVDTHPNAIKAIKQAQKSKGK